MPSGFSVIWVRAILPAGCHLCLTPIVIHRAPVESLLAASTFSRFYWLSSPGPRGYFAISMNPASIRRLPRPIAFHLFTSTMKNLPGLVDSSTVAMVGSGMCLGGPLVHTQKGGGGKEGRGG